MWRMVQFEAKRKFRFDGEMESGIYRRNVFVKTKTEETKWCRLLFEIVVFKLKLRRVLSDEFLLISFVFLHLKLNKHKSLIVSILRAFNTHINY